MAAIGHQERAHKPRFDARSKRSRTLRSPLLPHHPIRYTSPCLHTADGCRDREALTGQTTCHCELVETTTDLPSSLAPSPPLRNYCRKTTQALIHLLSRSPFSLSCASVGGESCETSSPSSPTRVNHQSMGIFPMRSNSLPSLPSSMVSQQTSVRNRTALVRLNRLLRVQAIARRRKYLPGTLLRVHVTASSPHTTARGHSCIASCLAS